MAPTTLPTPSLASTATPVLDAVVEAFVTAIHDPGFAGMATITGGVSLEGSAFPPDEITGSTSWHGADVAQELRIDKPTRTTTIAHLSRRSSTIEAGGHGYVLVCAESTCRPSPTELWSEVREPEAGQPARGPLSIVALLRSRTDLRHAGSEALAGQTLERLMTTEPVDVVSAFGRVGSFGAGTAAGAATGRIEVLVDADARPILIRAELSTAGTVSQEPTARVALELAVVGTDQPAAVEAPPPSRVIAMRESPNGYSMPVMSDWTLTAGKPGAATAGARVDRWVAPTGALRRELRVHLDMLDASTYDADAVGGSLGAWVLETYGIRIDGSSGGFGGAANLVSTTFDATVGGRPTTITAGPRFWSGPGECATGDTACQNRWSVLEIYADPTPNDVEARNLTQGLIGIAASLFQER